MSGWTGEKILAARKDRGLTQTDVAKGIGCRMQTVSEWETGLYGPKNAYQKLLSMFFIAAEPKRKKK